MKIVLFSRVPRWYSFKNERLVRRLTADGHEVCGVVVEQTRTLDSLREWKQKLGAEVFLRKAAQKVFGKKASHNNGHRSELPEVSPKVYFVKSHNSQECSDILRRLEPDLIVLRGCGIIKKHILDVPKIGVINPHYAKLPDFRGMDVTEWSVLCGAEVAVSVHTVNEGVDTGVVLKFKTIEPTSEDSVGSLRDKSAALVIDLVAEAVNDLANGMSFPYSNMDEVRGRQYFKMHDRLKELANSRLKKFGSG